MQLCTAILFSINNKNGNSNKHVNIKYFIVKMIENMVIIEYISTNLLIANP